MSHATLKNRIGPRLLLLVALAGSGPADAVELLAQQVLKLTGAPTKVVWPRYVGPDQEYSGSMCDGPDCVLMCFDTTEGKERILQGQPGSYGAPLITRDGGRVIWTDNVNHCSWICAWDGQQRAKIIAGGPYSAECLRWDPLTRQDWVYCAGRGDYGNPAGRNGNYDTRGALFRVRLDGLAAAGAPELAFDKAPMFNPISVSESGTWGATEFGHPNTGLFNLVTGEFKPMFPEGLGCFATIAPDNSLRHFFMIGTHHAVWMFEPDGSNRRLVKTSTMPGNEGKYDTIWPKFANQTRFLTVMWPYNPPNHHHVPWGNICLGRFSGDFNQIEVWVTISSTAQRQSAAEAWIMPGPAIISGPPELDGLVVGPKAALTLASPLAGVDLVYTLDGSVPTKAAKVWTAPVEVDVGTRPVVVKARALGGHGELSSVAEASLVPAQNGVEMTTWAPVKNQDPWTWFDGEPVARSRAKDLSAPHLPGGAGAVSYHALFHVPASGEVTFITTGRLAIDGAQVAAGGTGTVTLASGLHDLVLRYCGKDLHPRLELATAPDQRSEVPATSLFLPPGGGAAKAR